MHTEDTEQGTSWYKGMQPGSLLFSRGCLDWFGLGFLDCVRRRRHQPRKSLPSPAQSVCNFQLPRVRGAHRTRTLFALDAHQRPTVYISLGLSSRPPAHAQSNAHTLDPAIPVIGPSRLAARSIFDTSHAPHTHAMADSWEQEEDKLSQQAQNLNINNSNNNGAQGQFRPGGSTFTPGASSFTPGAQSFTPGQYQQYGGGYQQYGQYGQQYGQQGYSNYQQYGQQQGYPQYGQYGQQQYGQQGYGGQYNYQQQQQQQNFQPQQQQQQQQRQAPVQIAKRGDSNAPAAQPKKDPEPKAKVLSIGGDAQPKAKVLSIGADTVAPKVEKAGGTKVLSLGAAPAAAPTAKDNVDTKAPDAGAKVAAAVAIEKTGEPTKAASTSGRTSPTPSTGRSSPSRAAESKKQIVDLEKEQEEDVDEAVLAEMYGKEHINVIFLGHVDAGKSTLGGSILFATGMVDERTMDKCG